MNGSHLAQEDLRTLAATSAAAGMQSVPLHIQIRESIRRQVRDGELIDESGRLMTEAELGKHFGVSRITIRNAISPLVDEGMFERDAWPRHLPALEPARELGRPADGFLGNHPRRRLSARRQVLQQGMTNRHDADVREQLRERAVWQLKRLRFADDTPIAIEHAFYPPDIGLELEKRDLTSIIMYSVFEDELGHRHQGSQADDQRLARRSPPAPDCSA